MHPKMILDNNCTIYKNKGWEFDFRGPKLYKYFRKCLTLDVTTATKKDTVSLNVRKGVATVGKKAILPWDASQAVAIATKLATSPQNAPFKKICKVPCASRDVHGRGS